MNRLSIDELYQKAKEIRRDILTMITEAGSGHPGGSLSMVEILVTLYFYEMRHRPEDPSWPQRDRFILSKGHGAPGLYSVLAEAGYFPKEELMRLRKLGSPLQGHPDLRKLSVLEASTGSLGQGLSIGIGMALGARLNKYDSRVYVLIGDGECNEGQIWEAAMFAGHHRLSNLTGILDYNRQQLDDWVEKIINLEPLADKWRSFGWYVIEIDGHQIEQIIEALEEAKQVKDRSTMIIAHTVKGKGVSFMENNIEFHGKAPTREQLELALQELDT